MAGADGEPSRAARLALLDTTLRDGASTPGFRPTAAERLEIAHAIADAHLDVIEIASAGDRDDAAIRELAARSDAPTLCVIARATSGQLELALRLLEPAQQRRVHLYADVWSDNALRLALEAIWAARTNLDQVEFSPLRAWERPLEELVELALAAADSGATVFNLSDTAGSATPDLVRRLCRALRERLDAAVELSFHGHDDAGRATANALAACEGGARQAHVCVNGLGPRGGNTDAGALLAALARVGGGSPVVAAVEAGMLERAGRLVAACCGR